jgi:hypothetical protein
VYRLIQFYLFLIWRSGLKWKTEFCSSAIAEDGIMAYRRRCLC